MLDKTIRTTGAHCNKVVTLRAPNSEVVDGIFYLLTAHLGAFKHLNSLMHTLSFTGIIQMQTERRDGRGLNA